MVRRTRTDQPHRRMLLQLSVKGVEQSGSDFWASGTNLICFQYPNTLRYMNTGAKNAALRTKNYLLPVVTKQGTKIQPKFR